MSVSAGSSVRAGLVRVALVLAGLVLTPGCGGKEPKLVPPTTSEQPPRTAKLQVAGREVTVELAFTQAARARGLMHRTGLEPDHGMLFLFPTQRSRRFWMRDTLIGLDLAFLDADGTVINIEHGKPGVERPGYHSDRPAQFVLEMIAGWSAEHGLKPGDHIEIGDQLRELAEPEAPGI